MKWIIPAEKPGDSLLEFILQQRGIVDTHAFLNPRAEHIHDPLQMYGMKDVVTFLSDAIDKKRKIVIHGDFDVDGITATTIMWKFLYHNAGANVVPFIPNRFTDGYGLSEESIQQIRALNADVIVSVDCGIKDYEIVKKYHNEFDFVITDHHTLLAAEDHKENPDVKIIGKHAVSKYAKAVTHPQLNHQYPFEEICGAVVSWKVCCALNDQLELGVDMNEYIDLAMLGTVCDIMPLKDENRAITALGLQQIKQTTHIGLEALMDISGVNPREISTYHVGFALGPRINAAGRIDHALEAVRLLSTNSKKQAYELAKKLDDLNKKRQELTMQYVAEAEALITDDTKKILTVFGYNWPEGIIGLIAGRLTQKYNRPVLAGSIDSDGTIKGSARSTEFFHVAKALKKLDGYLLRHGGHAQAAGFQIAPGAQDDFVAALEKLANKQLHDAHMEQLLVIDALISYKHISLDTVTEMSSLEPFGQGHQQPIFALYSTLPHNVRTFGKEQEHIRAELSSILSPFELIAFRKSEEFYPLLSSGKPIHIAGTLGINEWNGNKKLQLIMKDVKIEAGRWN